MPKKKKLKAPAVIASFLIRSTLVLFVSLICQRVAIEFRCIRCGSRFGIGNDPSPLCAPLMFIHICMLYTVYVRQ